MALYAQETMINASEGWIISENPPEDTGLEDDEVGTLYRLCRRTYGRCISKVYIDTDGKAKPIGWVFVKRQRYEDTNEPYLQEAWITVHTRKPEVQTTYHYANIPA